MSLLAKKFAEAKAQQSRTPLIDAMRAAQEAALPPLEPGQERIGSTTFEGLDDLWDQPPPAMLLDGRVYAEGFHLVSGEPGHGKTTIVGAWACELVAVGHHVVWIDFEGGPRQTARRMKALGMTREQAAEFFHYANASAHAEDDLALYAERWPGALVVLDSMSKALARAGLNENDNSEVTQFTDKVVAACRRHRMPLVVIDHISKNAKGSDYSRGAGAKQADIDAHWRVLRLEDFNREQAGVVQLHLTKDREACLPFDSWWTVGDGDGGLPVRPTVAPEKKPETDELLDRIVAVVLAAPDGRIGTTDLAAAVGCDAQETKFKGRVSKAVKAGHISRPASGVYAPPKVEM